MNEDPRYAPVNAVWPEECPAITREEAEKAARRLFRHFGGTQHGSVNMMGPAKFRRVRRCWIALKPVKGLYRGWARLAHDVSHMIFRQRHPSFRPHHNLHARLEREIAQYIVEQGWLSGNVLVKPVLKPTIEDKRQRVLDTIERWERKAKRANNALKKLNAKLKRMDKCLNSN